MAKYYKTYYSCKCGAKEATINFKQPSPYRGALISHHCEACGKQVVMRIFKTKLKNQFKIHTRELE